MGDLQIKIMKDSLLNVLQTILPGLGKKEFVEQSTSFVFKQGVAYTFNDELAVQCPLPEDVKLDFEGSISAEEFYSLIYSMSSPELTISKKEGEIEVSAGRVKAGIKYEEVRMPIEVLGDFSQAEWVKLPVDFSSALRFCIPTCSKELSLPHLTCVFVSCDKSFVASTDNFQGSIWRLKEEVAKEFTELDKFFCPAVLASQVVDFPIESVWLTENWIHFSTATKIIISARRFNTVEFPSVFDGQLERLSEQVTGEELSFGDDFVPAIEGAEIFAKREHDLDEKITVSIKKGKAQLKGSGDIGWYKQIVSIPYSGNSLKFDINPAFFLEAIKSGKGAKWTLGEGVVKFTGDSETPCERLIRLHS